MIEKLFEKMIDKIIAKKLINEIKRDTAVYRHSRKIIKLKDRYQYLVKHYKLPEEDKYYDILFEVRFENSLITFFNYEINRNEVLKDIKYIVDEQIKRFVEP